MTTRSLTELSHAVMEKIGAVDSNSTVEASDHDMIVRRYSELMEGLRFEEIAYWENAEIPLLVFPPLTDLVSLHCESAFGRQRDPKEMEALELVHKRRMRRYTHKMSAGTVSYADDF